MSVFQHVSMSASCQRVRMLAHQIISITVCWPTCQHSNILPPCQHHDHSSMSSCQLVDSNILTCHCFSILAILPSIMSACQCVSIPCSSIWNVIISACWLVSMSVCHIPAFQQYVSIPAFQHSSIPASSNASIPAIMSTFQHSSFSACHAMSASSISPCQYNSIPASMHVDFPACEHVGMWAFEHVSLSACQHVIIPAFQLTCKSASQHVIKSAPFQQHAGFVSMLPICNICLWDPRPHSCMLSAM